MIKIQVYCDTSQSKIRSEIFPTVIGEMIRSQCASDSINTRSMRSLAAVEADSVRERALRGFNLTGEVCALTLPLELGGTNATLKSNERGTPSWPINLLYSRCRTSLKEVSRGTRRRMMVDLYAALREIVPGDIDDMELVVKVEDIEVSENMEKAVKAVETELVGEGGGL